MQALLTDVLLKRQLYEDTETQREHHVKLEAETRSLQLQAKEWQRLQANHQILGRGQEGFSPIGFTRSIITLPTLRFQISAFQNCEATNSHCFKPSSLWQAGYSSPRKLI